MNKTNKQTGSFTELIKIINTLFIIVIPTIGCVLDVLAQLQLHCSMSSFETVLSASFPSSSFPSFSLPSSCPSSSSSAVTSFSSRTSSSSVSSSVRSLLSSGILRRSLISTHARNHLLVYSLDGVFHCDLARVELILCLVRD